MRFAKFSFLAVCFVVALGFTVWGTSAIHYSHAENLLLGTGIPTVIALAGLAILVGIVRAHWRRKAVAGLLFLIGGLLYWWSGIEASNDRQWKPEVAIAPRVTVDGERLTFHNIRNFNYRTETDFDIAYYERTFDLRDLSAVDLVASYWMGDDIAHVFLSFAFGPDEHLAISIERRDEIGEGYSTVKGLFRQFELFYVVADERDVIGLRTNIRRDPPEDVYLYRVSGPIENGRRLLLAYVDEINSLGSTPEFYNTLLTNCTGNIWLHSRVNPGHLHYSWKVLLSGHVPEYLYEHGRLDRSLSFPELRDRSRINDRAREANIDADFSRRIREGLPGMSS
jgi:hypothetical protein